MKVKETALAIVGRNSPPSIAISSEEPDENDNLRAFVIASPAELIALVGSIFACAVEVFGEDAMDATMREMARIRTTKDRMAQFTERLFKNES